MIDTFTDFITAALLFCAVWYAAVRFMDDVMGAVAPETTVRALQMTFRVYRDRYGLSAPIAYKLARYVRMHHLTINEGWMRFDRGELQIALTWPSVNVPVLQRYGNFLRDMISKGYEV